MRNLIISISLLLVLVVTPKHAFAEPVPGFPHLEVADVFYAPLFNDTGIFGAFGGYLGGDTGSQIIDWSMGNTIPHSDSVTDDIVFSTSVGHFMTPANWFERMRITKEGNVGIGTASPIGILEIASESFAGVTLSTYSSGEDESEFGFRRARGTMAAPSAILAGDDIGSIFAEGYGTTAWTDNGPGIDFMASENWTDIAQGSYISFFTVPNGTATSVDVMKIDHNGNVGIGTASPTEKLDVVGSLLVRNGESQITIESTTVDVSIAAEIEAISNGVNLIVGAQSFADDQGAIGTESNHPLRFHTNDNPNPVMSLDTIGNVGIGTTDQFGSGSGILSLGNATTNPTVPLTDAAALYASGGELFAYDAAGNATQISPHDPDTGEWTFYSKNVKTGRVVRINMEKMIKKVEELTGEKFMEEWIE